MNNTYTIKNFRVFDEKGATLSIKPITILTGCNSSGKSSGAGRLRSVHCRNAENHQPAERDHGALHTAFPVPHGTCAVHQRCYRMGRRRVPRTAFDSALYSAAVPLRRTQKRKA